MSASLPEHAARSPAGGPPFAARLSDDGSRPVLLAGSRGGVVHEAVPFGVDVPPGRGWWQLVCRPDEPRYVTALTPIDLPVSCRLCRAKRGAAA